MNEFFEVFRVQDARIVVKINLRNTKSLRLGMNKCKEGMLCNEKIDLEDSFIYLGSIIRKLW